MHDESVGLPALELLAPAGNWDCAHAAVENGANAIYFGLESGFNARARAANFSLQDLPQLIQYLHLRGVRGYVTLNTLVFSSELSQFEQHVTRIAESGVDAVLVQDIGAAVLVREICPQLELHASTQMTLSSAEGLQGAAEWGLSRVVLPRELSIQEISKIADQSPVGLEAFVHGALCVAYSGQCLTSESLGGRSANRGQCAQACRLPYDLLCDGEEVDLGDVQYLLSPQDLAAYAQLPEMIAAGVTSFKIEGRLKTPEYVANVTSHYRQALDAAARQQPYAMSADSKRELELSFSRGFSPGWLGGCDHKMLVPGLSSAKRGIRIGEVVAVGQQSATVHLLGSIRIGDGVVFEGDRVQGNEQGGRIYAILCEHRTIEEAHEGMTCELQFRHGHLQFEQLYRGQLLWKTDDPQLTKRLRASFTQADPVRKTGLDLVVTARVGEPLRVVASADSGASCELVDEEPLPLARKHPITDDVLKQQLGRLGHTVYELRQLTAHVDGAPMVPLSVLGRMRKRLVSALDQSIRPPEVKLQRGLLERRRLELSAQRPSAISDPPRLHVLCRSFGQMEAILPQPVRSIYVDFADIRQYGEATKTARAAGARIFLATPRIEKPGEAGLFRAMERHGADGFLVRNLGGIRYCQRNHIPFIVDFSLNAANELTVAEFKRQSAQRVTVSYDLNRDQLLDLVGYVAQNWLEIVIHQHMPMFHMEHCVFCAVLSPGTNKHNCGRPCDDHKVQLRDRVGMEHPLHADVGCRNTLFNAQPQSSAEVVPQLLARGLRDFRVELLEDNPAQSVEIVNAYLALLAGQSSGRDVWQRLNAANRVGVTRGTLEERRNPLAIL